MVSNVRLELFDGYLFGCPTLFEFLHVLVFERACIRVSLDGHVAKLSLADTFGLVQNFLSIIKYG
jgi:hypothetical protein